MTYATFKQNNSCVIALSLPISWYLVSGIWYLVSGIWYLVSGIWYLVSGIW
ncbi:hypothetical protein [Photorhabdus luminescens]|uniref:hypothetical protein n=1 Tax=Photorhabdus luminescens TaxID=29488 RepID=UPI00159ED4D9|nr:hypothetical protein [Photorhabdus luminescens]